MTASSNKLHGARDLLRRMVKTMPYIQRQEVIDEIKPLSAAGFDYFLLVVLSTTIATLGLIIDSPAVIIGAMLVAPLMSPIIGIGLASITGDTAMLRGAISALLRGALLAVVLSAIVTFLNNQLPILSLQSLPQEVLVRTRPTPIDLVIALAGGLAAAYALTQPNLSATLPGVAIATALMPPLCTVGIGLALGRGDVAGGALLLFTTNAVTIAFSSVLVFFLRGFGGMREGEQRLPGSLLLSAVLTLIILIPLSYFSLRFFQEAASNQRLNTIVQAELARLGNAELSEIHRYYTGNTLDLNLTIRTTRQLNYEQVVSLQQAIVDQLKQPVALHLNQVLAERLDPLIPPTSTATATRTLTFTPGPSQTATPTLTASATLTATATITPSATLTPSPTATSTYTPTPAQAEVVVAQLPGLLIYQSPGGPPIGQLLPGQRITVLYRSLVYRDVVWIEIEDSDKRTGWVPGLYVRTLAPSPIASPSRTPQPALSLTAPAPAP